MQALGRAKLEVHIQQELPHLTGNDVAVLAEIVARLVDAYEPQRIYLFGSKARGDDGPDSDFDLMVIVPDDAEGERSGSKLAYQCLKGIGTAADVLVQTATYFNGRIDLRASLPATVLREGKLLMQNNPNLAIDTRDWFLRATEDLTAAGVLMDVRPPLLGPAAFHCQQAVEKALKGFLTWHQEPFRKTHEIREVGQQCTAIDPTLKPMAEQAEYLTDYAWKFRYPGGPDAPTEADARRTLTMAHAVYDAVLERLPPEVRPERPR